jgi:flavin reductase (DIM6/NTAB) family NADH-FMN oxidoreductase RutF
VSRVTFPGGTLLAPLPPALVTVKDGDVENVLTVGWTGILNSTPPKTYVSIRPSRFSHALVMNSREFVIHLPTAALARAADYCGVYTGKKVNKFEKCRLTRIPSTAVSAPTIAECPVAIECRVTDVLSLGTHDMFMADIVAVTVDESLLDDKGKLHMERADLCAYAHGEYFALGRRLGNFGFSARKKKRPAKK